MGVNLTSELEILKQASASGGSGVSSITAQDGLETASGSPITSTGTINEVRVSTLVGGNTPLSTGNNVPVPLYSSSTFPNSDVTITNNGRVGFTLLSNGTTAQRIGYTGLSTYDRFQFDATFQVTCTAGSIFLFNVNTGGPFLNTDFVRNPAPVGGVYVCTGSAQTIDVDADLRIGDTSNTLPSSPASDYTTFTVVFTGASFSYQFTSIDVTITQNV